MAGELSFFEVGVADVARAEAFYSALLGWSFTAVRDGSAISGAGVGGGLHGGDGGASPYVFFAVDDMDAAVGRVRELGGTADAIGDDEQADQYGRFMLCGDDQGSSFGLHEPPVRLPEAGPGTGELNFVSLGVGDLDRATAFYGALLGWTFAPVAGGVVISGSGVEAGIHGGDEGARPSVFFRVDDLDLATAEVHRLGGAIVPAGDEHDGDEDEAARFGRFALCRDDQGSGFGLRQPPE